jgi:hypothetical protein
MIESYFRNERRKRLLSLLYTILFVGVLAKLIFVVAVGTIDAEPHVFRTFFSMTALISFLLIMLHNSL